MKKLSGFTLISFLTVLVAVTLVAVVILLGINTKNRETELAKALRLFDRIRHATQQYLRAHGPLQKDIWTSDPNPCNPNPDPGKLKWADLSLENPHSLDGKWYYALYIEKDSSFSIGAISKDCNSRFFELVRAGGKADWNCDSNAGMRPLKEKDGKVTGCTYL